MVTTANFRFDPPYQYDPRDSFVSSRTAQRIPLDAYQGQLNDSRPRFMTHSSREFIPYAGRALGTTLNEHFDLVARKIVDSIIATLPRTCSGDTITVSLGVEGIPEAYSITELNIRYLVHSHGERYPEVRRLEIQPSGEIAYRLLRTMDRIVSEKIKLEAINMQYNYSVNEAPKSQLTIGSTGLKCLISKTVDNLPQITNRFFTVIPICTQKAFTTFMKDRNVLRLVGEDLKRGPWLEDVVSTLTTSGGEPIMTGVPNQIALPGIKFTKILNQTIVNESDVDEPDLVTVIYISSVLFKFGDPLVNETIQ